MFGVDLVANPALVWLVDLCLACDYLPAGWAPVPKEEMSVMPSSNGGMAEMQRLLASSQSNLRPARDVTWLPPLERLWHLTTTGQAPPQYAHHMCSVVTERHPLSGFVRTVMGLDSA